MATSREFVNFILDQCAGLPVQPKPMMGEYILYYMDKYAACLCDNRMLVKDVPAARALIPDAVLEPPYPGAKDMLVVENWKTGPFWRNCWRPSIPNCPCRNPGRGGKHECRGNHPCAPV